MKTRSLVLALLAIPGTVLAGCDDDNIRVDRGIDDAFRSRYPSATRVEWEQKNNYYVADFWQRGIEAEAWYDGQGVWYMTETDVRYADLPQAVKDAFKRSDYASWHIDDIDMLEYPDRETVYIIEVEQGKAEFDLYFTPDGVLAKTYPEDTGKDNTPVDIPGGTPDNTPGGTPGGTPDNTPGGTPDNGGTHQPSTVLPAIKTFIVDKYPQARIVDVDRERNSIEVDIVDGRTPREVVFSLTGEWMYTETEVWKTDVPAVVLDALTASQFGSWRIDDIDHYDTPTGEFYLFELESGHSETHLKIGADGNVLS